MHGMGYTSFDICIVFPNTSQCYDWLRWWVYTFRLAERLNYSWLLPARSSPFILLHDGTQQPWSSFTSLSFLIHDGWRVGLTSGYVASESEHHFLILPLVDDPSEKVRLNLMAKLIWIAKISGTAHTIALPSRNYPNNAGCYWAQLNVSLTKIPW